MSLKSSAVSAAVMAAVGVAAPVWGQNFGFEEGTTAGWTGVTGVGAYGASILQTEYLNDAVATASGDFAGYVVLERGALHDAEQNIFELKPVVVSYEIPDLLHDTLYEVTLRVGKGYNNAGVGSTDLAVLGVVNNSRYQPTSGTSFPYGGYGFQHMVNPVAVHLGAHDLSTLSFHAPIGTDSVNHIGFELSWAEVVMPDFYGFSIDDLTVTPLKPAGQVSNGRFSMGSLAGWEISGEGSFEVVTTDTGHAAKGTTGSPTTLTQEVATFDEAFDLSFDYQFLQADGTLTVTLDGEVVAELAATQAMADFATHVVRIDEAPLLGLTGAELSFTFDDDESGREVLLTNVKLTTPVPEPGTLALLGLAVGAGLMRRR